VNNYGNFFGITVTLFLVIDALGNLPTYLSLIKPYNKTQKRYIAIRELFIALGIMIIFHYVGQILLSLLGVSQTSVQISGGLILFLIAIRLIFSNDEERPKWEEQKLLIFPIATPLIAGPSVLAAIMIFAQDEPSDLVVLGAICIAWFFSSLIIFFAQPIHRLLKDKGLLACQRLMGLIVAIIAVQLFLEGIERIIK
jgi:multiple antibiotic resistance protein